MSCPTHRCTARMLSRRVRAPRTTLSTRAATNGVITIFGRASAAYHFAMSLHSIGEDTRIDMYTSFESAASGSGLTFGTFAVAHVYTRRVPATRSARANERLGSRIRGGVGAGP